MIHLTQVNVLEAELGSHTVVEQLDTQEERGTNCP
jgi:hypothetical protein